MPKFFSSFRRLRKESAGSVLILVVALIVILALLGTAFVATARIDRSAGGSNASAQIIANQLQSLQSEICTDIANGLYDQKSNYRPIDNDPPAQGTGVTTPTYGHFDSNRWYPGSTIPFVTPPDPVEWDTWLADRLPTTFVKGTAGPTDIAWRSVTRLPNRLQSFVNLLPYGFQVQLPTLPNPPWPPLTFPVGQPQPVQYDPWGGLYRANSQAPAGDSTYLIPTAIAITYPRSASESTPATPKVYPAFILWDATTNAPVPPTAPTGGTAPLAGTPFLAADADGDGIADSMLFDLGISSPSSAGTIEYFAAVRIVDNNSAVNLNTAWSRKSDFQVPAYPATILPSANNNPSPLKPADALGDISGTSTWTPTPPATGAANLGWLPSHVGLLEMLDPNEAQQNFQEMAQLNSVRFGSAAISSQPYDNASASGTRTDYSYLTLGDALWNQLGRRIQNPGFTGGTTAGTTNYQAVTDNGQLSFRFNLLDPSGNPNPLTTSFLGVSSTAPSVAEQKLDYSLYTDVINWTQFPIYNRWSVYPADKALYWFDYSFNNNTATTTDLTVAQGRDNEGGSASSFGTAFYRNPRALTVTRNPLSNAVPIHSFYAVAPPLLANNPASRQVPVPVPLTLPVPYAASYMDPYPVSPKIPIRASINTDSFGTLWRAFWNVMCDDLNPGPTATPSGVQTASGLPTDHTTSFSTGLTPYTAMSQIYTPPVNIAALGATGAPGAPVNITPSTTMKWSQYDQLLIRAAIAAVNAEGLRDPDRNTVISRCIVLPDGVTVEVFSNKLQPYIIAYDPTGAGSGHPTITLANPSNTPIDMTGWVLAYYQAGDASLAAPPSTTTIPKAFTLLGTGLTTIGANGQPTGIVTVSFDPTTLANKSILPSTGPASTDQILLMRPRLSTGLPIPINPVKTLDSFDEVGNGLWDYDPIDYVLYTQAFTGRGTTTSATPNYWTAVQALLAPPGTTPSGPAVNNAPNQIFNDDFPGPYAPGSNSNTSLTTSTFPYGSFSRLGDILKVPFIGSYRVMVPASVNAVSPTPYSIPSGQQTFTPQVISGSPPATTAVYFVPISMDAAACYTGTAGEQVGHFCPISADPSSGALATDPNYHSYDWAKKLFDYFTVIQNPGNDFSPNVNPGVNNLAKGVTANWSVALYNATAGSPPTPLSPTSPNWPRTLPIGASPPPQTVTANGTIYGVNAVANVAGNTANVNEENVGVDGLININTAPWQVLASLPMVAFGATDTSTNHYSEANVALAHAIVLWRDGDGTTTHLPHGPFKSIFDLNNVVDQTGGTALGFQNGWGTLSPTFQNTNITGFDSSALFGDFSPAPPLPVPAGTSPGPLTLDLVNGDFEKKFLTLSNISNLITTRSDTFTCYVVVQGWLNAGTNNPILVTQQRTAFIANRVAVGPGNTTVQTTVLPSAP